jgi:outer membrane protein OmpA-like peptidoglycan-associated protein
MALLTGGVAIANTDVNFKFDSSELPATAGPALQNLANDAMKHSDQRIVLDGHADHTGASDYNVGLSLRRAEAVRDKLVSLGVESERIVISAFGEDSVAARRVSAKMTSDSIADVVDASFARNGTSVTWERPMTTAQLEQPSAPVASR